MRVHSYVLVWDDDSKRARAYFLRGSCVWRVGWNFRRVVFQRREGCEGRTNLDDRAQCSTRDAKHGGQGCKAQGGTRAAILFDGLAAVAVARKGGRKEETDSKTLSEWRRDGAEGEDVQ